MIELWDLYDKDRNVLNKKHIRGVPVPAGEYHIVVNIWTINMERKILITQRHPNKSFGLYWECTGGSVIAGEDSKTGALRELSEEVGITALPDDLTLLHSICLKDRIIDTYITVQDVRIENLKLQQEEVVDAKFVTYEELIIMWDNKLVIPNERFAIYRDEIKKTVDSIFLR